MSSTAFEPRVTPRAFWPENVVDTILEAVAAGESLASVCARPGMPTRQCFYTWLVNPELNARYIAAVQQAVAVRHA